MSDPDHTTELSRLDLSDDEAFGALVKRHKELSDVLHDLRHVEREREEIGKRLIARLGNASSALAPDGDLVSTQTIKRPEYTVKANIYRRLMIRRAIRKRKQDYP